MKAETRAVEADPAEWEELVRQFEERTVFHTLPCDPPGWRVEAVR